MFSRRRRRQVLRQYRQRRAIELPAELEPRRRERGRRRRSPTRAPGRAEILAALGASRNRLSSALAAAVCMALLLFLALAPRYYVRAASVHGNQRLSADAIYRLSGLAGRHILHVDPAAVSRRLEALPEVERAFVGTGLPNRVQIVVEETPLALAWSAPWGAVALDARGRVASLPADGASLPRVQDEAGLLHPPVLGLAPARVATGRVFAETFGEPILYRPEIGFVHLSPEGWEVWLGQDAARAEIQARRLSALRPELGERARQRPVEMIDLRFEQWYYRMQGESP